MQSLEELFSRKGKVSEEEIKALGAKGELSWKGKKVVVDPFIFVSFFYEIEILEDNSCRVSGRLRASGKESSISECDAIFPICILHRQMLRFFDGDVDFSWIQMVYPHPKLLAGLEQKKFIEACEKKLGSPKIVWKGASYIEKDPLPILVLKDRTGGFANLWMDYGEGGKVETHLVDLKPRERFWENDLLETDFIKKTVGPSHYYCPLDKVGKSLSFLIEIGWTILDFQGKRVVRQGAASFDVVEKGEGLLLKGKVAYGEHMADVTSVFGAFNRRQQFVDLSPHTVGLLEIPKEWEDVAKEEVISEGVLMKRTHFGLLEEIAMLPQEYSPAEWKEIPPSSLFQGTLYDYQQKGLNWLNFLYHSKFSGLLADEMGLGKTIQLLAFFSSLIETLELPILIVMPSSLLFNWKREFERFLPTMPVYVHAGSKRVKEIAEVKVILVSYALLRQDRLLFESLNYSCLIFDEAQNLKNPESLTAQIACRLRSRFRLCITGTPVENRWEDLWSIFHVLMPDLLGEKREFPVMERVRKKIRPFTLRRLKAEVELNLPPKLEQIVWVDLKEGQRTFYDQFLSQKRKVLDSYIEEEGIGKHRLEILEMILRLRQICCHPALVDGEAPPESGKLDRLTSDLEEVVEAGHKVLVYSQFTQMLHLIEREVQERGWKYAYLDGKTKEREKVIEQFQNDPGVQIFLISLKAGGVGLNLTAADYVFLFDPWWNEAIENQAIDRAHRLGRKNTVIARRYISVETIEEKILSLKGKKRDLVQSFLEFEGDVGPLSIEELYALI